MQFKAAPPLKVPSAAYSKVLAEVFDLGRKASTTRSTQQTDTANFWADGNREQGGCQPNRGCDVAT
jgi:hypothetical protein